MTPYLNVRKKYLFFSISTSFLLIIFNIQNDIFLKVTFSNRITL